MPKELDLTKEQRDEIRGLMKTAKGGKRSKLAARDVKSLDVTAKDYDQQVTLLAEKAATEARERVVQRGELQKKVHAILTDKQKVKYKALREERKQKMIKRYEEKIEQIRQ